MPTTTSRTAQLTDQLADVQTEKDRLAKEAKRLRTRLRREAEAVRAQRQQTIGSLADQAGLFGWSDADFADVFQALARVADVPNPGVALAAFLDGVTSKNGHGDEEGLSRSHVTTFPLERLEATGESGLCP
jgi:hypothetical protein